VWKPAEEIEHCVRCHGPDTMRQIGAGSNHQQGQRDGPLRHEDHGTAKQAI
jgi:hypothetical protein